jgi:hypothetical protein
MNGLAGIAQAIMSGVGDQNAPPQQQPTPGPMPDTGGQFPPDSGGPAEDPRSGQSNQNNLIAAVIMAHAKMQSDGIAQQGQKAIEEGDASARPVVIKTTIPTDGSPVYHDIKNWRSGNATPDQVQSASSQALGDGVAAALKVASSGSTPNGQAIQNQTSQTLGIGNDALSRALQVSPKPGDEQFTQDFHSGYKAARELGASPAAALIDGIRASLNRIPAQGADAGPYKPRDTGLSNKGSIQAQVDRKKALDQLAMVQGGLPTVQAGAGEARAQAGEQRAEQSHMMMQESEFERFSSPQNLINYPTAGDALHAARTEFGPALTDERTAGLVTSYGLAQRTMQTSRQSARYEAMRTRITPDSAGLQPDLNAYVNSIFDPGNPPTPEERKTAMNMAQTAQRQWQNATTEKRQALALQGQEIELKRGQILVAQQGNAIAAAALKQQQGTGEAALAGLPDGVKGLVRGVSTGRIDSTELLSARNPNAMNFATLVNNYDPSWSTAIAPAREALYKSMTSGKIADQRQAINTVIPHLDELNSAAVALNNAPAQLWNRIANKGITAVGDPRVTRYMTAANAVSKELGRAYSGGGQVTDSDTDAWRASLNVVQSPAQSRAAVETLVRLLGGKARAIKDQVQVGQGPVDPLPFNILSPESRAILTKNHISPNQVEGDTAAASPAAGNVITDPRVFDKLFPPGKGK